MASCAPSTACQPLLLPKAGAAADGGAASYQGGYGYTFNVSGIPNDRASGSATTAGAPGQLQAHEPPPEQGPPNTTTTNVNRSCHKGTMTRKCGRGAGALFPQRTCQLPTDPTQGAIYGAVRQLALHALIGASPQLTPGVPAGCLAQAIAVAGRADTKVPDPPPKGTWRL
jgi:hypothetical protein